MLRSLERRQKFWPALVASRRLRSPVRFCLLCDLCVLCGKDLPARQCRRDADVTAGGSVYAMKVKIFNRRERRVTQRGES